MQKELGIILSSHGYFAKYAMESAELIVGKQKNFEIVSILPDKNFDSALKEIFKAYEKLDTERGVVVLVDIKGGTPSNISGNLLLEKDDVLVYTGLSMPILIEVLLNRTLSLKEISVIIEKAHTKSLSNLNSILKEGGDENVDQLG